MADQPIRNTTLIANEQKSKNWNSTQNVYIEGDNLEVLRLLQRAYAEKINMIYIDPPYNTGNDFVYRDNFHDSYENYLKQTGQVDSEGNATTTNKETNGRFHTDWLNMMYPRLKLARNLLTDSGVIFVSIDENELENLHRIMDEIFGANNFVATLSWRKKSGANDAKDIGVITESILLFAKNKEYAISNNVFKSDPKSRNENRFKKQDKYVHERGKYYLDTLDRGGLQYSDSMNYGIKLPNGKLLFPNSRSTFNNDGWIWKWSKEKVQWGIKNGFIEFVKSNSSFGYTVKYKVYQFVDNEGNVKNPGSAYSNVIDSPLNSQGNTDVSELFDSKKPFSNPKPVKLIEHLINIVDDPEMTILDFFSGSGTTQHAVMKKNSVDGGTRKTILVQLPEDLDDNLKTAKGSAKASIESAISILNSLNLKHKITNIAEERIRRAGKRILSQNKELVGNLDVGFKVYELKPSTIRQWDEDPTKFENQLELFNRGPFIENYTSSQRAQEIALKSGIPLSVDPIIEKNIYHFISSNKEVFVVLGDYNETILKRLDKERKLQIASIILIELNNGSEVKFNLLEELKQDSYLNSHFNLKWL